MATARSGTKRERRFLVEPAEAVVVRRIFEEYVAGIGVNRVAARLNDEGIRTRQGSKFSARSILAVLPSTDIPRRGLPEGRNAGHGRP